MICLLKKPNKRNLKSVRKRVPFLFILPWIIGFIVFTLGPLIFSLIMSLFDWPIAGEAKFVGFDNFTKMFTADPQFYALLYYIKVWVNICSIKPLSCFGAGLTYHSASQRN